MTVISIREQGHRKFWLYRTTMPGTVIDVYVTRFIDHRDGGRDYYMATDDFFEAVTTCKAWLDQQEEP